MGTITTIARNGGLAPGMEKTEQADLSRTAAESGTASRERFFRQLVSEHQEMVVNTCYRFVFNREDAEDIAQEVFVEVFRSLENFREESKLSTWIYRIAVTKSLDHLRRLKRKKRFSSLKRLIGAGDPAEELAAPAGITPPAELERLERTRALQDALDTLPDNQKSAFLLSKQEGYSNQEIAELLGTSVSAVESLVHRAKKKLQEQLESRYRRG